MAPEQARGEVDRLDERCDVFGLGAILCEILTGQPPYVAGAGWQVYPRAVSAELTDAFARLAASGAEPELLRLARTCLAANPEGRPRHASAVAEAVTAYLNSVAERLRQAELARAAAQVKAQEERKRRKLAVGLAAAVVGVVLVGGGSAFWLLRQAAEQRIELRQGVEVALDKAAELQQQARWREAEAVLEQAEHRLGASGPADLRRRVAQARDDLRLVGKLDAARLQAATVVEGKKFDYAGAERQYASAFRQGQLGQPGDDVAAVAERLRASALKAELVAALDDWASISADRRRLTWLLAVARRADPDRWRDRFRDPKVWQDRKALERLTRQAPLQQWSPQLVTALASALRRQRGDAVALLTAAQARHPQDFWLNFNLGYALWKAHKAEAAIGYYRAALALRPQASAVYNNLGNALREQGQWARAIACYQKAIALDPKNAKAYTNLGNALYAQGQLTQAIICHQQALALDPKLAKAYTNLGVALKAQGQWARAIACHKKALALDPKLAGAHNNLGSALAAQGQWAAASACYRKALALDPKLAEAHNNLGAALQEQGQLVQAIACYRKALALEPKDTKTHYSLGNALYAQGHWAQAIACYQKALAIDPKDAKAHSNLGSALAAQRQWAAAAACYQKALAIDPKDANAHSNLGRARAAQGQWAAAAASYQKALAIDSKYAKAHNNLGVALHMQGQWTQAIACYQKALAIDPKDASALTNLGNALQAQGQLDGAIACYHQALAIEPKNAKAHYNLGNALAAQRQWALASACYRQAIQLDPKYAEAHCNLGLVLQQRGQFTEALAALRCGHQLGSRKPRWPHPSALWVHQAQRWLHLDAQLPQILQGTVQPASAAERLEYAQLCWYKQRYAAAVRFYADAFTADPKLAGDLKTGHRYNAAWAAALAGIGQGQDAGQLAAPERACLRQQARTWLHADLHLWRNLLATGQAAERAAVQRTLRHWQRDPDLAGIRDAAWIANLPTEELRACRQLWADVTALLQRASGPK
jgi:tetratricopeptide (TPR) repeat protein